MDHLQSSAQNFHSLLWTTYKAALNFSIPYYASLTRQHPIFSFPIVNHLQGSAQFSHSMSFTPNKAAPNSPFPTMHHW